MNHRTLYTEFAQAFMSGPATLVSTPGWSDERSAVDRSRQPVLAVLEDDFAGSDSSLETLLQIMVGVIQGRDMQLSAAEWMYGVAQRHDAFHSVEEAGDNVPAYVEMEAQERRNAA